MPDFTQQLHGSHYTLPDCSQAAATVPYVTVPVIRDAAARTSKSLTPWVEPQRRKQGVIGFASVVLEYDPNYPNRYIFPRKGHATILIIVVKPGTPLPPGLFIIREGFPAIIRHEIPYSFTPTVPIPGKLTTICIPEHYKPFKEYTPADQCHNFYLNAPVTLIISDNFDGGLYTRSGYSFLQPSVRGMRLSMYPEYSTTKSYSVDQ